MEERKNAVPHGLSLQERKKLVCSGVLDVNKFHEQGVLLKTSLGQMEVAGKNLQITKLNLDSGDVEIEGEFFSLLYRGGPQGKSVISRLLK